MSNTDVSPERVRCPECGTGSGLHCSECSLQTVEQKIAWGPYFYALWREQMKRNAESQIRLLRLVTLWQGKHAMLRHENNKLRKKLMKQVAVASAKKEAWLRRDRLEHAIAKVEDNAADTIAIAIARTQPDIPAEWIHVEWTSP